MSAPATDPITPVRRRFAFRLPRPVWIGLAAVVLAGLALSLQFGVPIYRQDAAIREIERLGGQVGTRARGPEWLRNWMGKEWVKRLDVVVTVDVENRRATDDTLSAVRSFTGLRRLLAANCRATDAGLKNLSELTDLEWLWLDNAQITGNGLAHLKRLTKLKRISLNDTAIGDEGLAHLSGMTDLEWLVLDSTQVGDLGLQQLAGLTKLEWLQVAGTQVTDAGLANVAGLTRLRELALSNTKVTDGGLEKRERKDAHWLKTTLA